MEDGKIRSSRTSRLPSSSLPVFSFVGGKGGVGKTTCAAVLALAPTAAGQRAPGKTLLVSTDPASSLASALAVPVSGRPRPVRGAPGLHAANVDAARAFQRWLAPRRALVAQIAVRGTYLDDEDVARLLKLSLPGIDEVIGLIEVVRLSKGFDTVVVDTAPTGHTLRLLAAPVLLGRVADLLDNLQSHHRVVVSALRGSYRADAADTLIADLQQEGEALAALLRDPGTTVSWVTLPEPMALEETEDAMAALGAARIPVRRLIVNRVTAAPPQPCRWCEARRRFESRALRPAFAVPRLRRRQPGLQRGDVEIVTFPEVEREPRGLVALRRLARLREPWRMPAAAPPLPHRVRAETLTASPTRKGDSPPYLQKMGTAGPFEARWLLFGGKGGVGKSTCAAAAALELAETRRVLLLSTDPAHSLGDVFGERFGNTPRAVAGAANLHVREIDAAEEMVRLRRRYVDAVDEAFARIARAAGGDQAAFRDLIDLAPPGIDEVIAIAEVAEAITEGKGDYDVIVTDTAPTGHALRLLQTPSLLREWTQALMAILLKYREVVGAGSLAALLVQLSKRLRGLQDVLSDGARARFVVVTRPAALPSDESRDLIAALDRLGLAIGGIIVNAVGRGTCRRCRGIARAQSAEIARFAGMTRARSKGYAIIEAPAEVPPPHGVAALRAWGRSWRRPT
jgi:arsenite-transporting ATPase